MKRIFLIVLDSLGIGEMPDASEYSDKGSNTLKSIYSKLHIPYLKSMGLFNIEGVEGESEEIPIATYARMKEISKGKDTTIGHWEIAGIISEKALPTYPNGFPKEVLDTFEKATGKGILCNKPYSGTKVLDDYGKEHIESGKLIVYTSADSVFQIAAHEDVVPMGTLYEYCRAAREILSGEHGVGRVIARPFEGEYPHYKRTFRRHDYSLNPPKATMLDKLAENGYATIGVGKISDIFAGRSVSESCETNGNRDGMEKTMKIIKEKEFEGLCFINLVDFDMLYGHRNDIDGYAKALNEFDVWLGEAKEEMKEEDILIITADHGCDPGAKSTDHTREYTPMIIYGKHIKHGHNLGTRKGFCDIAATILDIFKVEKGEISGNSFALEAME